MKSVEVRQKLNEALVLDLIGPSKTLGDQNEMLRQKPSSWYLAGFLVPTDADEDQKVDPESADSMEVLDERGGADDAVSPDKPAARRAYMPSSMGISLLLSKNCKRIDVTTSWGDYKLQADGPEKNAALLWHRTGSNEAIQIEIPSDDKSLEEILVPNSGGLKIHVSVRNVPADAVLGGIPDGTRSVSLFLVNRRVPAGDEKADEAFAFQAHMDVYSEIPFVARPNLRSLESDDWDERVADLQFRDSFEYSVGHSISTHAVTEEDGHCHRVETCWIPSAQVERVAPSKIDNAVLSMEVLALLRDGDDAKEKLSPLVDEYRDWIEKQDKGLDYLPDSRKETIVELMKNARFAAEANRRWNQPAQRRQIPRSVLHCEQSNGSASKITACSTMGKRPS